jgi:hypothetical protein
MRCLFCKEPSSEGRSVEHILPESIGNRTRTLAPGIVCDPCNNYFARKVEGPVLAHDSFRNLRARWQIPNKQGVMPRWRGEISGANIGIGLRLGADGYPEVTLERAGDRERADRFIAEAMHSGPGAVLAFSEELEPPKREMSRFLAKMAFEALAQRHTWTEDGSHDNLIDHPHWDAIRDWARRGKGVAAHWPYSQRVIAPELSYMHLEESNTWVRAGFIYDIFMTKRRETYFGLCLYGYEWVINLGGPSIKGYEEWLVDNANISPLVERLGSKLVKRQGEHGFEHYWDGEADLNTGIAFDQTQIQQWSVPG